MVDRFTYPFAGVQIDGNSVVSGPAGNLAGITISETADSNFDNLDILGDIPNDRFTLITTGPRGTLNQYPLVYVGTGGGGFIAGIAGPVKGGSVFGSPSGSPFGPAEYYENYNPTSFVRLGGSVSQVNFTLNRGEAFDLNSLPALCLVEGSLVRTIRGDIAVEKLRTGDVAITLSGRRRRIVWTGCRHLKTSEGNLPFNAWPVRILKGAFGPDLPRIDVRLSPGHPILISHDERGEGGALVPAMCLINGTSIERLPVECITYWHVELDEHDILVTEGLPVESYIDLGSRAWFEAESDNLLENPDFVPTGRNGRCRPVVTEGPLVEAERARLSAWFADTLTAQCAWDEAKRCSWLAV